MAIRNDFDDLTVNVLDQIATLLKVSRDLRGMQATFKNSPDLSAREGKPYASQVTAFASKTGTQLLTAVFETESTWVNAIAEAQRVAGTEISAAIEAAHVLADMEREAMGHLNLIGNVVEHQVVKPLQHLRDAWAEPQK